MTKPKTTAALMLATFFALAACNTVDGAGKDLKSAGDAVTGAADRNGAK